MALSREVSPDYRITSDAMNVIVNRRHLVDPSKAPNAAKMAEAGKSMAVREDWREVGYFSTLEQAIKWTVNQRIREADAGSMEEILAELRRIADEIKALRIK